MNSKMLSNNLVIHEDEFSLQIKHPEHSRFFIRIDKKASSLDELIVTDFMLSGEYDLALAALSLLRIKYIDPSQNMKLLFKDILPNKDGIEVKDLVVIEHDIIKEIVTSDGIEHGYEIANSYLDFEGSKINTIIEIVKSNHG